MILNNWIIKLSGIVFASDSLGDALTTNIENLGQTDSSQGAGHVVSRFVVVAVMVAIVSLVGIFIVAGYKFTTSQGNADKLKDAQEMLTNGVIGFLIIAFSVGILYLITNVFNMNI